MQQIDLRSDTVTRPTTGMREAMLRAEVGDDVYGDDPTVNELQEYAADLFGFEEALFTCSGTQANLIALLAHCERGDEYLVGQTAHTYKYEGGGAAVFGSIQPQPIEFSPDGTLDLKKVAEKIKPNDFHFAKTRLLCLENTQYGQALPLAYFQEAWDFTRVHGLRLHLDGARLMNAAVKQGIDVKSITKHFDTVSVCLSKGLGAPVGSILCGSSEFIARARRWRKVAGGGMRQAGILAAAGLYALQYQVTRLAEDHDKAWELATLLTAIPPLQVKYSKSQTNMVFAEMEERHVAPLAQWLKKEGILVNPGKIMRMVMHLDVAPGAVSQIAEAIKSYFQQAECNQNLPATGNNTKEVRYF